MVTGGQTDDPRGDRVRLEVDGDDPRAVVVTGRADALVGVGRERAAALRLVLEGEIARGTVGLKSDPRPRGSGDRTGEEGTIAVQDNHVRGERLGRRRWPCR